jgi:hypothetical protein
VFNVLDAMGGAVVRSIQGVDDYSDGYCCTVTFPDQQGCDDFFNGLPDHKLTINYLGPLPSTGPLALHITPVRNATCYVKRIPRNKKRSFGDGGTPSYATRIVEIHGFTGEEMCVHKLYLLLESGSRGQWEKLRNMPMRIKRTSNGWCIELTATIHAHELLDHLHRYGKMFKTSSVFYGHKPPSIVS